MKKWIPIMATLLIAGVCFTWTAQSFDDDKRRDGDRDKPREGERERARDGDRERDGQARELEEWLEQREKQINSLRKQGKIDQAEALAQRTRKELVGHRRAMVNQNRGDHERGHREHGEHDHGHGNGGDNEEFGKWVNQQERHIAELRKAGKKEEAAQVLKHVQNAIAKFRGQGERREREHGERGNEARMKHIGAAIEHLQAAGLKNWAEELANHARGMNKERGHREEREDREEPEHRHERHEHEHGEEAEGDGVDQLRREVNELRNALREIQKHLEKRR
jgi:hypothetical protein